MILDDEGILIREASNSCQDPIKMLFDHYDDESSSLNLLNRYMNFEGFKWKKNIAYYILVDSKDLIHCQILKDPHGSGIINITTYPHNEECVNRLHKIFTTCDMLWGLMPGSIGETSVIAIALGAVLLLWTGVASWKTMLSVALSWTAWQPLTKRPWNWVNPNKKLQMHYQTYLTS